jgi:hypothetical protein
MTIVERSVSTECIDILGNSFLFGVARRSVPDFSWRRAEGA